MVQRFLARAGLDEIFAQLIENGFIGDELARLIVHHENIYFFLLAHFHPLASEEVEPASAIELRSPGAEHPATGGTTFATPRAVALYSPVSPDILKPPLRDIFHGPLSWPWQSKR